MIRYFSHLASNAGSLRWNADSRDRTQQSSAQFNNIYRLKDRLKASSRLDSRRLAQRQFSQSYFSQRDSKPHTQSKNAIASTPPNYVLSQIFSHPTAAFKDLQGLSITGVGKNILVSAPGDDSQNAIDAGAAYLFDGNPQSATFGELLMEFRAPQASASADFGGSVTSIGKTIVIGESFRHANLQKNKPGSVYLFDGDPSSSTFGELLTTLQAPVPQQFDMTGFSVSKAGRNVVIGAFGSNAGASGSGAAYLFDGDRNSATFGELLTTFANPNPGVRDHFGVAVTGIGRSVVIGAFRDDVNGVDSGAAYLFDANPRSATFGQLLKTFENPNPSPTDMFGHNDEFGHSIARVGKHCLIGAFREDIGAFDAGAAYLYDCDPLSPTFGELLKTFVNPTPRNYADGDLGENFGFSMTGMGGYALIGTWRDWRGNQPLAGSVQVYDADPLSPQFGKRVASFTSETPTPNGSFGAAIAGIGTSLFIGAIGENNGAGAVYQYTPVALPQKSKRKHSKHSNP